MLENRPIVVITIGYIIGIISGLYCKISIALIYFFGFIIYLILNKPQKHKFKLISFRRYVRYLKIIVNKKVIILLVLTSLISNSYIIYKTNQYDKISNIFHEKNIKVEAIITSNVKSKKYSDTYKIKIIKIYSDNNIIKNKNIYLNVKKSLKTKCNYGDKIQLIGTYSKPKSKTNFKGFDYKEYLQTQGICGTIEAKSIYYQENPSILWDFMKKLNSISIKIKNLIKNNFEEDISNVLLGILLGDTDDMSEELLEDFSNSNILHIVAVSGMHVGYILLFCNILFVRIIGKRKNYFLTIIMLLFYMFITGCTSSVFRATIMLILMLFSKILYKKSDVWTNICISLLIQLIINPFCIRNIGLLLSYVGTIAIIIYGKVFNVKNKILNVMCITFSVTVFIIPIIAVYFNKIPIFSLVISVIIGFLVGPVFILGFSFAFLESFQIFKGFTIIKSILKFFIDSILLLSKLGSKIKFGYLYVITPSFIDILIYYAFVTILIVLSLVYRPKKSFNKAFIKRIRNLVNLSKYRYNQNKDRIISIFLIFILFFSLIKFIPKNLKIYFIDVGQGDSCLVVTPMNKKILIDGGGSESYNVGKNILTPYLLDRGVRSLDYIIISHFDTDHVRTVF